MTEPPLPPNSGSPLTENPHDVWLSIRPASAFLGIGPRRLNALRKKGDVPARRRGLFGWEFRENDLMLYVEKIAGVAPSPEGKASATAADASFAVASPAQKGTVVAPGLEAINAAIIQIHAATPRTEPQSEPPYEDAPPVVRLANAILAAAIEGRASDIHVEPGVRNVRIRNRIDGAMREIMALPRYVYEPVVRRFHIMADLDPFGKNLQMGRIPIKHNNQDFNLRVLSTPM